eukprot:Hpha_TRINITY_DN14068_c0_g1::TRINITY_DN14068_c0_g1_i3::g.43971::m.43971
MRVQRRKKWKQRAVTKCPKRGPLFAHEAGSGGVFGASPLPQYADTPPHSTTDPPTHPQPPSPPDMGHSPVCRQSGAAQTGRVAGRPRQPPRGREPGGEARPVLAPRTASEQCPGPPAPGQGDPHPRPPERGWGVQGPVGGRRPQQRGDVESLRGGIRGGGGQLGPRQWHPGREDTGGRRARRRVRKGRLREPGQLRVEQEGPLYAGKRGWRGGPMGVVYKEFLALGTQGLRTPGLQRRGGLRNIGKKTKKKTPLLYFRSFSSYICLVPILPYMSFYPPPFLFHPLCTPATLCCPSSDSSPFFLPPVLFSILETCPHLPPARFYGGRATTKIDVRFLCFLLVESSGYKGPPAKSVF